MKILDRRKASTFFNSLRIQLMLSFTCVSVIVLCVGSYLTYKNMLEIVEQRNQELVLQQFAQTEQNILNLMGEVDRISGIFLMEETVQNFLHISSYSPIYQNVEMVRKIQELSDGIILNYPYINSIYLFTKNNEVIGMSKNNSLTVRQGQKEHPFFSTEVYKKVKTTGNRSWNGGFTRSFFNEAISINKSTDDFLIVQSREVRSTLYYKEIGVLAFNIDESYLYSLYGKAGNTQDRITYIVDGQGVILSGSKGSIGTVSEDFLEIDKASNYGSITLRKDQSASQLIYYKLQSLDWYILSEVPLRIESESAFMLQRTFIFVLVFSIFAIMIASFFWLKKITNPLNRLSKKMADVGQGNLGLTLKHIPKNELGLVITRFNEMSVGIAELLKENQEMEEEKRKLEIETLQAQINPHFLYNTLNMIKWMATVVKAKNVVDSLVALGNILKPIFKSNSNMHTLQEEFLYLENYIKIMNWRFGNAIKFNIHAHEEFVGYLVPRFILQPIVENSITHGLISEDMLLGIDISIVEEDEDLIILVTDTGAGISHEKLEELNRQLSEKDINALTQGIGILNVNKRIRLHCGDSYGIRIESPAEEGGTRVILRVAKGL